MNTSDVLNRAADYIEQYGHIKGKGHGADGEALWTAPACSIGAITIATSRPQRPGATPAVDALNDFVGGGLVSWNDAPERTAAEVVEAFRACALIEAAREEQDAAWATYAEQVSA